MVEGIVTDKGKTIRDTTAIEQRIHSHFSAEKVRNFRTQFCQQQGSVRAQVMLPADEIARLRRQAEGRTLAILTCGPGTEDVCSQLDQERVRALGQQAGYTIADVAVRKDSPDAATIGQLARGRGATRALHVRLTAQSSGQQQQYLVCHALATGTLWDAESDKQVAQATPIPPVNPMGFKGVVYADSGTPAKACRTALMDAWKELEAMVYGLKASEGSQSG
jgi:hypothetical protein